MILRVSAILKECRAFVKCDRLFDNLCPVIHFKVKMSLIWSFNLTLKRTTAQLSCRNVGHFRDYAHPNNHIPSTDNIK